MREQHTTKDQQLVSELVRAQNETRVLDRFVHELAENATRASLGEAITRAIQTGLSADAVALYFVNFEDYDLISQVGCRSEFAQEWPRISKTQIATAQEIPSPSHLRGSANPGRIVMRSFCSSRESFGIVFFAYDDVKRRMPAPAFTNVLLTLCTQALESFFLREKEAQRQLEAKMNSQSRADFLTNICHEIRTPVGVIKGFSEMLSENQNLTCEQTRWNETIRRNAQILFERVGEVLDFSELESEDFVHEMRIFDPRTLNSSVDAQVRFKASEKGLQLRFINKNLPAQVMGEYGRTRQILLTLVNNAVAFTERGGITVELRHEGEDLIGLVTDSGPGIDSCVRESIFRPHLNGSEHLRLHHFRGNKIGLSSARTLARSLGGDLELKSSVLGRGSVFQFRVRGKAFLEATPEITEPNFDFRGKSILLVEDCPDNQDLVTHLLKRFGAEVELADTGAQGLIMALNHSYHLVLLDIQLPEMDGRQVLRNLRALGYTRPIAALTALALQSEKEKSRAEGFDAYLTKPIQLPCLLDCVHRLTAGM